MTEAGPGPAPLTWLDCAATSHHRPPQVAQAVLHHLVDIGASAGRGGHRLAVQASRELFQARRALATLLGVSDPARVILGSSATEALNLALHGLLRPGDHVVSTAMEHNAVARPLSALRATGVQETVVPADPWGRIHPGALRAALRPQTRLVVVHHASNVSGTLQDLAALREASRGHLLLVDAAQTAGAVPIDVDGLGVDLLAASGHKGLLGPAGTGLLVLPADLDLPPRMQGGTGSASEDERQPAFLPDRLESGTRNGPGIAGLLAGVQWLLDQGVPALRAAQVARFQPFIDALDAIPGLSRVGPPSAAERTPTVSIQLQGWDPSDLALALDREHGVLVRAGLHCAPRAHKALSTWPQGTVRLSAGPFTTVDELAHAAQALATLARRPPSGPP